MSPRLQDFCQFYGYFDATKIDQLARFYAATAVLKDPIHQVEGLDAIKAYFSRQCQNLHLCQFKFHNHLESGDQAFLHWTMDYVHPRIKGGKRLSVEGASEIRFKGEKVVYHADFYDMGAMLYEHLPVIGSLIGFFRSRLANR